MSKFIETIKDHIPHDYFTTAELLRVLPHTPDGRYGLMKRAMNAGDIIRIRRGLFALSRKHQRNGIDLFELAQKVYGPSYVSLESALSYHGWIPEGVQTTTSVSFRRSKEFTTPIGVFSYSRISRFNYIGVERITSGPSSFFVADPTRALIDLVFVNKKDWTGFDPLLSDLRIEQNTLTILNRKILMDMRKLRLSQKVTRFIDGLTKGLNT